MLLKNYPKQTGLRGMSGIYKLYCENHNYIGSSKNLRARLCEHNRDLYSNQHSNEFMQNVYNKYGCDKFEFEIVEYCEIDQLLIRESFWIKELNTDMNLQDPLTHKFITDETSKKLSAKSKLAHEEGRMIKQHDICSIEAYDIFGNYLTTFENKNDAAEQLKCDKKKISKVASGYKKGINIDGVRLRYSISKVPVLKFNIDPKEIGRYYNFYTIDESGNETLAFVSTRDVWTWFGMRVIETNGNESFIIKPKLKNLVNLGKSWRGQP